MFDDYELQLDVLSLDRMLGTITLLSDHKHISCESPELPIQAVIHRTTTNTLSKIPTLSNEGIKQSIEVGLSRILDFIKKLYKNILKFIKKITSRLFGKSGFASSDEDSSVAKSYDLEMDEISKDTDNRMLPLVDAPLNSLASTVSSTFSDAQSIDIIKSIFPKDNLDDLLSYDFSNIDDMTQAQINFIFKTDYTAMTELMNALISNINDKGYLVPKDARVLKLDKNHIVYESTKDAPNPKHILVSAEDIEHTATLDDVSDFLESDLLTRLTKALHTIDENEINYENTHIIRKLYAVLNMIQSHTNTLVIVFNRNSDLIKLMYKVCKYQSVLEKIKLEEK